MLANPKKGTRVIIRYKKSLAGWMPLHGKTGIVTIASKGKPRNHGVVVDGVLWVVPCGNLNKVH